MTKVDIGSLLEQARAAHLEYRKFTPHQRRIAGQLVTSDGDPVRAREALELAGSLRKQASDADPDRTDPAWTLDQARGHDHDAMTTFYAEQCAKDTPVQASAKAHAAKAARK